MNWIHSSDLHIGEARNILPNEYLNRQKEMLQFITRMAVKYAVAFVSVVGDIFHRSDVKEKERTLFLGWLIAMEQRNIPVYMTDGQHDLLDKSITSLEHIALLIRKKVFKLHKIALNQPELWQINENLSILAIPYERERTKTLQKVIKENQPDHGDLIVMAHECLLGASTDSGWSANDGYPKIPLKGYNYLALGDIHKSQQMATNAWYSGAPMQHNYGDELPKGILLVDTETWEPRMLKTKKIKPLITLERLPEDLDSLPDAHIRLLKSDREDSVEKVLEEQAKTSERARELLEAVVKTEKRAGSTKAVKVEINHNVMEGLPEFLAELGLSASQQKLAVKKVEGYAKKLGEI